MSLIKFTCVLLFPIWTIGQTNLIHNGSFEDFVPIGSEFDLPSDFYYPDFITTFPYLIRDQASPGNSNNNFDFICHQIDCWETYNIDANSNITEPGYNRSCILVLSSQQGTLSLNNPNYVMPFGIPYEYDYTSINPFGNGANLLSYNTGASNGDTYIAMITNRYHSTDTCSLLYTDGVLDMQDPKLTTTLKEEIIPHHTYTISIDLQKIAHLNSNCGDK